MNKLQSSRFEFKYLLKEQTAREVARCVLRHLEPDEYTRGRQGLGYMIYSLYLDSPDYRLCRATLCGEKNRFKLRLRIYDQDPSSPVFFEIKRRDNLAILKQRASLRRDCVAKILSGHPPRREYLWKKDDQKSFQSLVNFCELRDAIDARPAAYTAYYREGYELPDDNIYRVTFDRQLRAGTYTGSLDVRDWKVWPQPYVDGVVLELKFTDRFPLWMNELVQEFDLYRTSMPKYVECLKQVRRDQHLRMEGYLS